MPCCTHDADRIGRRTEQGEQRTRLARRKGMLAPLRHDAFHGRAAGAARIASFRPASVDATAPSLLFLP
jgi:hypothetical protein